MFSLLWHDTKLELEPFPHIVSCPALPDKVYAELSRTRPTMEQILDGRILREGKSEPGQNCRVDMPSEILLAADCVSAAWWSFTVYHLSQLWWMDMLKVFGQSIADRYPGLIAGIGRPLDRFETIQRSLIRKVNQWQAPDTDKHILLDVNVGLNTPSDTKSRVRGPHLDNPRELISGLLYMPDGDDDIAAGGDLLFYRWKSNDRAFYGKYEIPDDLVEPVKRIAYQPNTLVMFLNSAEAVHGVTEREPCAKPRLLANVAAELRGSLYFSKR